MVVVVAASVGVHAVAPRLDGVLAEIVAFIQSVNPLVAYVTIFAFAFIENIFPPSPSDSIIVLGGSLVGMGQLNLPLVLLCATAGSTLGFIAMYKVGDWFGIRILETGRFTFIPRSTVALVETWFQKYGYWLIVANRFLSGTRAVVSFFAGMARLDLLRTTVLCALSALAWNSILITGGFYLGNNWERIGFYISTYSDIVTGIILLSGIIWFVRMWRQRKTEETKA